MAFKHAKNNIVFWPVKLIERNPDGGEQSEKVVYIQYRIFGRSERKERERKTRAALSALTSAKPGEEFAAANVAVEKLKEEADADVCNRICGWRDLTDAAGQPLPFSAEALAELLEDEAHFDRIAAGLNEASRGARAKNS